MDDITKRGRELKDEARDRQYLEKCSMDRKRRIIDERARRLKGE